MSKVIGIDLGASNSRVSVLEGGKAVIIPTAEGERTTPSVAAFSKAGERMTGQIAKRQAATDPERVIFSIKREMGSDYRVSVDGRRYAPQEISAMILRKLKADAEAYLGAPVSEAVITVPAYFTASQRQAAKDAGKIAGLKVLRIISEPAAAALAYGVSADDESAKKMMVCDFGGASFDALIFELDENVIEVLATAGNNRLGGDDFDERVTQWMAGEFKRVSGIDLSGERAAMRRLKEAAEKAKIELSSVMQSHVSLPYVAADASGWKSLDMTLSRVKFNELTSPLVDAAMGAVRQAMVDADLRPADISKVLLVGGSSRIPAVQEALRDILRRTPFVTLSDESIAMGAALQAGIIKGNVKGALLLEATAFSLGVEAMNGVCTKLIDRNMTIPVRKRQIFSTAADNQTSVEINVLQGEREMAAANYSLGRFHLDGIAPARRGVPQIEVTFDIDVNGIVNVSAKDLSTGKEQRVTITGSSDMSEEELARAVEDAERYEAKHQRIIREAERYTAAERRRVRETEKETGSASELAELQERYDRQAAEYANYRKRVIRERKTLWQDATADAVLKFLPIYDNLARAAAAQGGDNNPHKRGLVQIFQQAAEILKSVGVTEIDALGTTFDPEKHEAVSHIDDMRYGKNEVSQVFQSGFMMNGKVIRHAVVQVAN